MPTINVYLPNEKDKERLAELAKDAGFSSVSEYMRVMAKLQVKRYSISGTDIINDPQI